VRRACFRRQPSSWEANTGFTVWPPTACIRCSNSREHRFPSPSNSADNRLGPAPAQAGRSCRASRIHSARSSSFPIGQCCSHSAPASDLSLQHLPTEPASRHGRGIAASSSETTVNSGLYAACAGLRARVQHLDLVGHNLANVNTTGFRGQQPTFSSLLVLRTGAPRSELNVALNDFGVIEDSRVDLLSGNLERTGNQLDLAIEGKAFFVVQTLAGVLYTRNGSFRTSPTGQLTTSEGDAVLGEQGPITVPGGVVSISPDGTLSVGGAVAGKLKLVEFSPGAQLKAVGTSYYSSLEPMTKSTTRSYVRQGMLESSNVNAVSAAVSLIALQRHAEMLQRSLSSFHNEFNRIAAQDLPRI